jgi:hypothetical protein
LCIRGTIARGCCAQRGVHVMMRARRCEARGRGLMPRVSDAPAAPASRNRIAGWLCASAAVLETVPRAQRRRSLRGRGSRMRRVMTRTRRGRLWRWPRRHALLRVSAPARPVGAVAAAAARAMLARDMLRKCLLALVVQRGQASRLVSSARPWRRRTRVSRPHKQRAMPPPPRPLRHRRRLMS